MFDCARAPRLPTTIVSTARAATAGCHCDAREGRAWTKTRRKAPKAAVFTPADMSAVTVVGAASPTPRAHMWERAGAAFKPRTPARHPAHEADGPGAGGRRRP